MLSPLLLLAVFLMMHFFFVFVWLCMTGGNSAKTVCLGS